MNAVKPSEGTDQVKAVYCNILRKMEGSEPLESVFGEEYERLQTALSGGPLDFLKYFPGKSYFAHALNELGIKKDRYVDIICNALAEKKESKLRRDIELELKDRLPERRFSVA